MQYKIIAKIIEKSWPKSGKVRGHIRNILVDEILLASTIHQLFVERDEKKWELMEILEVHKE